MNRTLCGKNKKCFKCEYYEQDENAESGYCTYNLRFYLNEDEADE